MYFDSDSVRGAADLLATAGAQLSGSPLKGAFASTLPYSTVSGLDQTGQMHGSISGISEPEATRGLAEFLSNAATLLREQADGYVAVDGVIADSLQVPGGGGGLLGGFSATTFDGPKVSPFGVTTPAAGRPWNLEALVSQLTATDNASMSGISANWSATASTVGQAMGFVPEAIAALAGSAETESIRNAMNHLSMIETIGGRYVYNASLLGAHTAGLVTVSEANSIQAAAALALARGAVHPAVSKTIEETFLAAFAPKLNVELTPTVPAFNELLPQLNSPSGGQMDSGGGLNGVPDFARQALPKVVQQGLVNAGMKDLAYAQTPTEVIEQFGRPNPEMLDAIAAGATPTQLASAAAPTLPPAGAMGLGTAGGGMPSGMAMHGAGGAGHGGVSPMGAVPASAAGGVGGAGGLGGASGAGGFGMPIGGVGAGGTGANGRGAGAGLGTGGFGAGTGRAGTGMGAGMMPGFGGTGTGGAGSYVAAGQGPGATARAGGMGTGGMHGAYGPAAGAAGRDRKQGKRGRVQAVTSAVEREGNLKALLGEAPEVVPGVIGAWVREPRR